METALITGASRGLGLAMAGALGRAGVVVGMIARSREALEAAARTIDAPAVRAWPGDVTDHDFMRRVVAEAERELGPITLLVNNAGILGPIGPLADVAHDDWWRTVEVTVRGPALAMQLVLPRMCGRGRGGGGEAVRRVHLRPGAGNGGHRHDALLDRVGGWSPLDSVVQALCRDLRLLA